MVAPPPARLRGCPGIVLGRFQRASSADRKTLAQIVRSKGQLDNIPRGRERQLRPHHPDFHLPHRREQRASRPRRERRVAHRDELSRP
jgi:hypothetical protein